MLLSVVGVLGYRLEGQVGPYAETKHVASFEGDKV